ncbi:lanosterol synthase-like protein, partial [Phakopsora pachyrhizi]
MTTSVIRSSRLSPLGSTDLTRWHLDSSAEGQVIWSYDSSPTRQMGEQSFETKYWLSSHPKGPALPDPQGNPLEAAQNGFEFYRKLQSPDGHWSGEYGGPLFLTPGLVIGCYVTETPLSQEVKTELVRYLANEQRQGSGVQDRGWGLHIAGKSTVFGTALNYVACRLLGVDAEHPMLARARATLHSLGGATGIPTWGKVWLSLLNVYDWEGVNPITPEIWLLPDVLPFHPWRWWVHSRQVYLPMSYISGKRLRVELNPLLESLREELYTQPYGSIDWPSQRNSVSSEDLYCPHHPVADALFWMLGKWEKVYPQKIRNLGLKHVYELCKMEDENTSYQNLGPVNKVLNLIVSWDYDGPESESFRQH